VVMVLNPPITEKPENFMSGAPLYSSTNIAIPPYDGSFLFVFSSQCKIYADNTFVLLCNIYVFFLLFLQT
jgi:hypothetical protein